MKKTFLVVAALTAICSGTTYLFHQQKDNHPAISTPIIEPSRFQPTVYSLPDVQNIRDCGGWTGLDGRKVRTGRIIRTAEYNNVSSSKAKKHFTVSEPSRRFFVDRLRIRTDVDLRSDKECRGLTRSPLGTNVVWRPIPFYAYSKIGKPEARESFTRIFCLALDERNYPMTIHCRRGRDRAGSAIFLLNGLLGVSEGDLRYDWELTERLKGHADFDYSRIDGLFTALREYEGETINRKIESYVLSLGFTPADIARFREIMLEPAPAKL